MALARDAVECQCGAGLPPATPATNPLPAVPFLGRGVFLVPTCGTHPLSQPMAPEAPSLPANPQHLDIPKDGTPEPDAQPLPRSRFYLTMPEQVNKLLPVNHEPS